MKLNWKWIIGIVLILALIALPIVWQFFTPFGGGYSIMHGYRYGMPITGGYGMTSFQGTLAPFGMWLMWLIPLGVFILIGFAFGWAANQFTRKQN